ncbi:MAG TPA: M1 family aminopeptidase, partial [Thermoanaerobaculia bacterium]|nr:M1 family aminopeptidase [Thermoanaerobaculia bacterium]
SVVIASKWTVLVTMIGCIVASGIATGVLLQLAHGYRDFAPLVYLALFDFAGVPLALCAAAVVLIHTFSPNRYVGMMFVLMLFVVAQRAQVIGLEHHLWRFATAPPVKYTEMNAFGDYARPFHWYMLHWSGIAALFLIGAAILWRTVRRTPRRVRIASAVLAGFVIATGTWILFNTDVLNARTTTKQSLDWRASYEKAYRRFETLPQPRVAAVDTNVDLFPRERRYRIAGRYELVNETTKPINTIFVAIRREARVEQLAIPSARLVETDARFGMRRFELNPPLAPHAKTELRFALAFAKRGFVDDEQDDAIVENGSYVTNFRTYPTIGYRKSYEIRDPRERRKRDLPVAIAKEEDEENVSDRIRFAAVVSTDADQTVIAPGALARTWTRDGRRYFDYRADAPILHRFAFASGRYATAKQHHDGVDIEIDYHPSHGANVPRMLEAAALSLDRFNASFGPYPHRQLRIVEVPSYWPFGAFALPGTIFFVENRGFLTDTRNTDRPDLVTRRVAHEIAHQWWGNQINPPAGEGATVIVESLAKYSELLVLEQKYGRAMIRGQLAIELDRYLAGRSNEEEVEVPLARAGNQAYLYYAKGSIVMHAIRDHIGEEAMNAALRRVATNRNASIRDLVAQFPDPLVQQWLTEIVLYDLRVESARVVVRADGQYDVHVRVAATKSRADGRGNESPIPLRESIALGVFGRDDELHLQKYALHEGINDVVVVVKG